MAIVAINKNIALTFAGQSLWGGVPIGGTKSTATKLFELHPGYVRYTMTRPGFPWQGLLNHLADMDVMARAGKLSILMMLGGTQDYINGRTGAQCYADQVTYAAAWRSRGGSGAKVIGSTTTPSIGITGGNETRRTDGNALVLADASDAFDAVVDMAGDATLSNSGGSGYDDGTHLSDSGGDINRDLWEPHVQTIAKLAG